MTASERPSIRQNHSPPALPDLCNVGVMLRVLIVVNLCALAGLLARDPDWNGLAQRFAELAVIVEPTLIAALALVCGTRHWLSRLPFRIALAVAATGAGLIAWGVDAAVAGAVDVAGNGIQAALWSALLCALVLAWLTLRQQAHSPALAEARLMALTARIRPHFLFNSLNAILGVMRAEPRRAEAALEELAELFRALMQDPRELVLLSDEIALSRRYLDLERLRLGERLQVNWDVESCPPDALTPPLMLQPLLENSVYHGVEPADRPCAISIRLARVERQVRIDLSNPLAAAHTHASGNQMALANIRERLMLFFDLEASITTEIRDGSYHVRILIPYRRGAAP